MYKHYIFNLYGTLIDIATNEEKDQLWSKMAMLYGYYEAYYTPEELKEKFSKAQLRYFKMNTKSEYPEVDIENVFYKLYKDKKIKPKNKVITHTARTFRLLSTEHIKRCDDVLEVLEALKKNKKNIYLLANAQRAFAVPEIKLVSIKKYLGDRLYFSSDFGYCAPDPKFYKKFIEEYDLNPKYTLVISNHSPDINSVKNLGLNGLQIHTTQSNNKNESTQVTLKKLLETLD